MESITKAEETEVLRREILWESLKHDYAIWHFIRYTKIVDLINSVNSKNVLDVGCGIGLLDLMMKDKNIVGVDSNREDIREAKHIKKKTNLKENSLCFVVADLHFLPFKKQFDVVICSEVLEHLPKDRLALRSILPTLREGGFLFLTLPNAQRLEFPQLLRLRKCMKYPSHVKEYQIADLQSLFRALPLKIEKIAGIYLDFPFFHIFSFPFSYIFNIPINLSRSTSFSMKYRFFILSALQQINATLWMALDGLFEHYTYFIAVILRKSSEKKQ